MEAKLEEDTILTLLEAGEGYGEWRPTTPWNQESKWPRHCFQSSRTILKVNNALVGGTIRTGEELECFSSEEEKSLTPGKVPQGSRRQVFGNGGLWLQVSDLMLEIIKLSEKELQRISTRHGIRSMRKRCARQCVGGGLRGR